MGRPSTGQAKTPAERMAAYRARRAGDAEQLNVFLPPDAMAALRRLARHREATQADVITFAIEQAESDVLAEMTAAEKYTYRKVE